MKNTIVYSTTSIYIICAILLSGCGKQSNTDTAVIPSPPSIAPETATRARVSTEDAHPIPQEDSCGGKKKELDVIHIRIWDVREPDLKTSILRHYKSDKNNNDPVGNTVDPQPEIIPTYHTKVDFDAAPYFDKTKNSVVIILELKEQPGLYFKPGPDTVMTDKASHGEMFCVRKKTNTPLYSTKFKFYAKILPTVNGKPVVGSYTFYLSDGSGHDIMRVAVDPSVKNEG